MIKSMFSAVSGLRSHQTMMDVIGNNIANVNTAGFKASRVAFTDVYYQTMGSATSPGTAGGSNGKQIGYGAATSSIDILSSRGGYGQTDKSTDVYISGEGYLVAKDGAGRISYTRVGNLSFDAAGSLVDSNGNYIMGKAGGVLAAYDPSTPINLSELSQITVDLTAYSNLAIGSDGTITGIDINGAIQTLGQIALATFANPDGLAQDGSLYMKPTGNSGNPVYTPPGSPISGVFVTGGLEMSNVDLSKQLTDMIIAERGFQANSRVITTSDEILQDLVNLKR
jgi:flagellar hook protein FlgE